MLRNAGGIGLALAAAVVAAVCFQSAGDRSAFLAAMETLDNAARLEGPDRERDLRRASDALAVMVDKRQDDPAPAAALARLRVQQAAQGGADRATLLNDADAFAQKAQARGANAAEMLNLRAGVAVAAGPPASDGAGALLAQSYTALGLDRRLAPERAPLALRLWADLDEPAQAKARQEVCLLLREVPGLTPSLEAAAVEAEAPLLPSDFAEWRQDAGCQPGEP